MAAHPSMPQSFIVVGFFTLVPWFLVHTSWLVQRRRIQVAWRRREWPLGSWMAFHLRALVIPAIPVLMGGVSQDLLAGSGAQITLQAYPSLYLAGTLVAVVTMFTLSPFLVRLAFHTRSLPRGELRTALEAVSEKARFRCLDIRVVPTQGFVTNAAFVGILGRLRYVILTDGIIDTMSSSELAGVFAHEMGHSKRRHILMNLTVMLGFICALNLVAIHVDPVGTAGMIGMTLGPLIALPLFFIFVFAPVARRFETEADVFAGETLGDPRPIVMSLSRLGAMYPDKRSDGGMIHPSLDDRVAFLTRYFGDPELAPRFKRAMRRLKTRLLIGAALPFVVWAVLLPGEIARGGITRDVWTAVTGDDVTAALAAHDRLERWLAAGGTDDGCYLRMALWQTLSTAYQDRSDLDAARPWVETILRHVDEMAAVEAPYNASIIAAQQAAGEGRWGELETHLNDAYELYEPMAQAWGVDHPEIVDEATELRFLAAGRDLLRGGIPDISANESGPEWSALRRLRDARARGEEPPEDPLVGENLEAVIEGWRVVFVRRVAEVLRAR